MFYLSAIPPITDCLQLSEPDTVLTHSTAKLPSVLLTAYDDSLSLYGLLYTKEGGSERVLCVCACVCVCVCVGEIERVTEWRKTDANWGEEQSGEKERFNARLQFDLATVQLTNIPITALSSQPYCGYNWAVHTQRQKKPFWLFELISPKASYGQPDRENGPITCITQCV